MGKFYAFSRHVDVEVPHVSRLNFLRLPLNVCLVVPLWLALQPLPCSGMKASRSLPTVLVCASPPPFSSLPFFFFLRIFVSNATDIFVASSSDGLLI